MVLYNGVFPLFLFFCADKLLGISMITAARKAVRIKIFFIVIDLYLMFVFAGKGTQKMNTQTNEIVYTIWEEGTCKCCVRKLFRYIKIKIVLCDTRY